MNRYGISGTTAPHGHRHAKSLSGHTIRGQHQMAARKPTVPLNPSPRDVARFQTRFTQAGDDDCWIWTGALHHGYGAFFLHGNMRVAPRVAYAIAHGDIEARDLVIDHICRNRACVNPAHLEAVTNEENLVRSPLTISGSNVRKQSCPRGHAYDMFGGQRRCRTCHRATMRRYTARKRGVAA